jgi:putative endonuclease
MERNFFVYILSNWTRKVLYVGVTNNLSRRLLEHMNGTIPGFTQKYNCKDLIYYEQLEYINNAISREKEIKNGVVKKKRL